MVVGLHVAFGDARERALRRPVYLSWDEFELLHREQEAVDGADAWLDTTGLSAEETAERVAAVWAAGPGG